MGLEATNFTEGVRSICAPRITASGAPSTSRVNGIPDDDSALAVIRHLHRADVFGIDRGCIDASDPAFRAKLRLFAEVFSRSLAAYVGLVVEVSNGRFSAKALREAIDSLDGAPGMHFWTGILGPRGVASLISRLERSGVLETGKMDGPNVLAWLRDHFRSVLLTVLLSMQNIEAERVLYLLRALININSANSRDR